MNMLTEEKLKMPEKDNQKKIFSLQKRVRDRHTVRNRQKLIAILMKNDLDQGKGSALNKIVNIYFPKTTEDGILWGRCMLDSGSYRLEGSHIPFVILALRSLSKY
jgi:hypothetical protein